MSLRRVGHKGADLIVPGNTAGSFDAALAAGVDMIEFDVVPEPPTDWREVSVRAAERRAYPREPLLLAHDWRDASGRAPQTLEEGLDHLASEAFAGIDLDIDLKLPGYELRVIEALRERDLLRRALLSTQYRSSLATIRACEPAVRLGWSVPKLRRDPFGSRALLIPTLSALQAFRTMLPARAARALRTGVCDALMAHWRLVTPRLVAAIEGVGGELYVWTVDELPRLRTLQALGVTGVITNDPRLFASLPA
ncbi:MAG: glycerophosphodiester phosphodiesterase [Solirubrobacteraceae bacterium]